MKIPNENQPNGFNVVMGLVLLSVLIISLNIIWCGNTFHSEQKIVGLRIHCKNFPPSEYNRFQNIYWLALEKVTPDQQPTLTVLHCDTVGMVEGSTNVQRDLTTKTAEIWIANQNAREFERSMSLVVALIRQSRKIEKFGNKLHKKATSDLTKQKSARRFCH